MASQEIPVLPTSSVVEYLGEGAANIVYRFSIRYPTPPPSVIDSYEDGTPPPTELDDGGEDYHAQLAALQVFESKLLRVRKNLPTTAPQAVAQENWLRLVKPLFDEDHIVDQCLVEIKTAKVIERLNKELEGWEKWPYPIKGSLRSLDRRPTKRHGIYLADDEHGLLVTDMTPGELSEEVTQFKPKWLLPSPSAPPGSVRCRQCARVARLGAEMAKQDPPITPNRFCPLDLVSEYSRDVELVASQMERSPAKAARLQRWLETNTVLPRLRDMQRKFDPEGIFKSDPTTEEFRLAMTLRDCTLFLRMPGLDEDDDKIEARLGDLDVKSPAKADYWRRCEQELIDEGWYTGAEKEEDRQPLTCSLSPDRWDTVKLPRKSIN
ncbi:inositol-pentakisphosphate 2-kinase [Halenospora varia]|nr:inositol-pentakisphosphate 2-kinase [Halenospora varia]